VLEVVLEKSESIEAGVAEAHALLSKLGIESSQLLDRAYVDLLREVRG
jgi:adenylate cyclase class IV